MRHPITVYLLLLALAVPARAADGWIRLKAGMTRQEAAAIMGEPVLRGGTRGYEQWFFDQAGEVALRDGKVIYWTVPQTAARPVVAIAGSGGPAKPPATLVVGTAAARPAVPPVQPKA